MPVIDPYVFESNNLLLMNYKLEKTWREQMESRPSWGHYPDIYNLKTIHCWLPAGIPHNKIDLDELKEITYFLKENIDNLWEGPIGYMGFWKFRFTTEEDYMVFKLLR